MSLASAFSLVTVAGSLFGFDRAVVEHPLGSQTGLRLFDMGLIYSGSDTFMVLAVAGGLAGVLGLLVIHRAPRAGWVWLLVAGTMLGAAVAVPELAFPPSRGLLTNPVLTAAIGAGPVLVIMGLLGAGNWLMHSASTAVGAAVAGLGLAAPLLGGVAMSAVLSADPSSVQALGALNLSLAAVSIAGAVGAATMLPALRRRPAPPPPTPRITAVGVIAALLPTLPNIVLRLTWDRRSFTASDPIDPFRENADDWVVVVTLTGLVIFVAAIGLAAALGSRALGATLAAGFVLFGMGLPVRIGTALIHSSAGAVLLAVLGFALGAAAAMSSWRAWYAGAACAVAGTVVVVTSGRTLEPVAALLLPLVIFAAVTAIASATATVAEGAQAPAVIGALAVATQVGLVLTSSLAGHSQFTGDLQPTLPALIVAAGIALLLGGLLVVALRMMGAPVAADQAELSPEVAR